MAFAVTDENVADLAVREIEDQIALVRLAMEKFSVALMRCSAIGSSSTVTVPDEDTAEIFRAALQDGAKTTPTLRLIDVVVDNG